MDNTPITKLANARRDKAIVKKGIQEMQDALSHSSAYLALVGALSEIVAVESEAMQEIRDLAMQEFEKSGNKHPHETITVKEYKDINIIDDPQFVREWCLENMRPVLRVDEKAFKNAIKSGVVPSDFFTETVRYEPTIAQDLSEWEEK